MRWLFLLFLLPSHAYEGGAAQCRKDCAELGCKGGRVKGDWCECTGCPAEKKCDAT